MDINKIAIWIYNRNILQYDTLHHITSSLLFIDIYWMYHSIIAIIKWSHDRGQALHLTAASPERGSSIDGPGAKCRVSRVSRVSPGLTWLGPACRVMEKVRFHGISMIFLGEIMGKWMENGRKMDGPQASTWPSVPVCWEFSFWPLPSDSHRSRLVQGGQQLSQGLLGTSSSGACSSSCSISSSSYVFSVRWFPCRHRGNGRPIWAESNAGLFCNADQCPTELVHRCQPLAK